MELLQRTASVHGGSGQCNSCNTLPHYLGTVGSGTRATHCLTACGLWAVQLLQYTAALPGGSGLWNSCNALPHCLGEVGSAAPAMHCHTAWGRWAVQLLQCAGPPAEGIAKHPLLVGVWDGYKMPVPRVYNAYRRLWTALELTGFRKYPNTVSVLRAPDLFLMDRVVLVVFLPAPVDARQ